MLAVRSQHLVPTAAPRAPASGVADTSRELPVILRLFPLIFLFPLQYPYNNGGSSLHLAARALSLVPHYCCPLAVLIAVVRTAAVLLMGVIGRLWRSSILIGSTVCLVTTMALGSATVPYSSTVRLGLRHCAALYTLCLGWGDPRLLPPKSQAQ